ncbi:GIY-YIG nuclease family protein [Sphingopyxis sp. J-6]|uniref:GIY-YIG nuclease family protein n=1 Tax=Sphingopyxis sp. J-6 TaxID=3122054 RepID=UPI003983F3F5
MSGSVQSSSPGLDPGSIAALASTHARRLPALRLYHGERAARHGTLYTGVTSHLIQRICQHRGGSFGGFTDRYGVKTLVWFELAATMHAAIAREKRIKNWQRKWKIELIEAANPDWRDLAEELGLPPLSG